MKKLILFVLTLLLTGCFNSNMTVISNTKGYLSNIDQIESIDSNVVDMLNSFSISLYNNLYEDKNVFVSPLSVYLALGMVYNGSNGLTREEMTSVLNANNIDLDDFNILVRDLQYLLLGYSKSTFNISNSIWIRDTYSEHVLDSFLNNNKTYYGAFISSLEFNDTAKNTINNWVSKTTNKKIKTAIDGDIDPLTVMYLINTIYFKSDWEKPFEKNDTYSGDFFVGEDIIDVDMMNKDDSLGYYSDDILEGVLLPYEDKETAMFILLPNESVEDITLTTEYLNSIINSMKNNYVSVNITMPKVKIEYEKSFVDVLSTMGMSSAFNDADFSNL
jgi:serpin B